MSLVKKSSRPFPSMSPMARPMSLNPRLASIGRRAVGERAVAIVPKQPRGSKIAGDEDVGVSVAIEVDEARRKRMALINDSAR